MRTTEVLHAWASSVAGRAPSLSIEITKECPLRCPGCYAVDAAHLGGCIFARTTNTISADLSARITPCQFGGDPDCEQCGCTASMGLAAIGHHRVIGPLTAGHLFMASDRLGKMWRSLRRVFSRQPELQAKLSPFTILRAKAPVAETPIQSGKRTEEW